MFFILFSFNSFAESCFDCVCTASQWCRDNCSKCLPDLPVPIDGGISYLLIAGAAYGGYRVFKKKGKEEEIEETK